MHQRWTDSIPRRGFGLRLPLDLSVRLLPDASPMELRAVKLSFPHDPAGSSLMDHNRALHNPPIAVPGTGLPSRQSGNVKADYLLVCEATSRSLSDGRWRFTLESSNGDVVLDAEDEDFGDLNRLTLLAAVRGLEALDGPSSVTLLSRNRYLIRSLSNSLPRWRQNDFRWEHFGRRIDVQHAELWRRIDRALGIHRVEACLVSSCLVSHGMDVQAEQSIEAENVGSRIRVDRPHSSAGNSAVPAPSDRLKRLLAGSPDENGTLSRRPRRGRFTSQDLDPSQNRS